MAETLDQSNSNASDGSDRLRYDNDSAYNGFAAFTSGFSGGVTKVSLKLNLSGTPSGNVTAKIYSDNANKPGTQNGGDSSNVSCAAIDGTLKDFTWSSNYPICLIGVKYWIVITGDFTISTSNFVTPLTSSTASHSYYRSADASTWTEVSGGKWGVFNEYSDPDLAPVSGGFFAIL